MTPAVLFFIELIWLALFGWYFATDYGTRKRVLALVLVVIAVGLSIVMIYPPDKKIPLGLDIKGGTSFLIRLQQTDKDKDITTSMLDQAVEVIRKRVDYFGASEPIISPVGKDRILVQIPGLSAERIHVSWYQWSKGGYSSLSNSTSSCSNDERASNTSGHMCAASGARSASSSFSAACVCR